MLFCCKLALATEKKAKIEISTKMKISVCGIEMNKKILKLQIVVELCAFQPIKKNLDFIFPPTFSPSFLIYFQSQRKSRYPRQMQL